ncbi:hypothetical protein JCGZ_13764 [Jatropha curcas]|uniref:Uncharacterized protein n=1 Tax=Jatropha curcas TaxID=180498 RepID=A0A067K3M8_JATCU|nr:hypothetical protein JCGZ_13764 [Jatropha curcas]
MRREASTPKACPEARVSCAKQRQSTNLTCASASLTCASANLNHASASCADERQRVRPRNSRE